MGPSAHRPAAPGAAWHDRPAALRAAPPKHDVRPLSAQPVFSGAEAFSQFFGSGGFQPVFRERRLSASGCNFVKMDLTVGAIWVLILQRVG